MHFCSNQLHSEVNSRGKILLFAVALEVPVTAVVLWSLQQILRAASGLQVPPHRSCRKVRGTYSSECSICFLKVKRLLCLLAFVLTSIKLKGFTTLRGESEVQVQREGGKMECKELLQTGCKMAGGSEMGVSRRCSLGKRYRFRKNRKP